MKLKINFDNENFDHDFVAEGKIEPELINELLAELLDFKSGFFILNDRELVTAYNKQFIKRIQFIKSFE